MRLPSFPIIPSLLGLLLMVMAYTVYSQLHFFNGSCAIASEVPQSVTLPFYEPTPKKQLLTFQFDVDYSPLKRGTVRIVPDDCLLAINIDKKPVDLSGTPRSQRCDWQNGFDFPLGNYLANGMNHIEFIVQNRSGNAGLDLYHDGSDPLYQKGIRSAIVVLTALLLLYPLYRRRQLHVTAVLIAGIAGFGTLLFYERLLYELSGVYTWDTPIYWAVGHGILNGYTPYFDLFETKPPGIFLIAALSLSVENSYWAGNLSQSLVLLLLALIPTVGAYCLLRGRENLSIRGKWYLFVTSLLFGISVSLYTALRSGEIQVESFGAAAIALYALLLLLRQQSLVGSTLFVLLASIALLLGIGLKEPFLLTAVAVSFVLNDTVRTWFKTFMLPLLTAILLGAAALLLMHYLEAYLEGYFTFMLGAHVTAGGSPFERAADIGRLFDDLNTFQPAFAWALTSITLLIVLDKASRPRSFKGLFPLFLGTAMLYLVSMAVGMGGQYYNHHYVFAVPFYIAVYLHLLRTSLHIPSAFRYGAAAALLIALAVTLLYAPTGVNMKRARALQRMTHEVQKEAAYVDSVLDASSREHYLFIGANGPQLYAFTTHSPAGPLFFQYNEWLDPRLPFLHSFFAALHSADLIVYDKLGSRKIKSEVDGYIAQHFTGQPWQNVRNIPRKAEKYTIYFRRQTSKLQNEQE